jgi:hypothetical protein
MKGSHAKRKKKKKCPFKSLQTINPSRDSASCNNNNDDDDDETKQATTKKTTTNKTKQNQSAQNQRQKTHSTKQHNIPTTQCDAHTKPN